MLIFKELTISFCFWIDMFFIVVNRKRFVIFIIFISVCILQISMHVIVVYGDICFALIYIKK